MNEIRLQSTLIQTPKQHQLGYLGIFVARIRLFHYSTVTVNDLLLSPAALVSQYK